MRTVLRVVRFGRGMAVIAGAVALLLGTLGAATQPATGDSAAPTTTRLTTRETTGIATGATTRPTTGPAVIELGDTEGGMREPLEVGKGLRGVVIVFVGVECPICNAYSRELGRLTKDYGERGFGIYLVDVDADVSAEVVGKHAREFELPGPVLLDPSHLLVRRLGAKVTPEAFVVVPGGDVVYGGRIDNLYFGLARRRFEATTHELRDALDAVVAGKKEVVTRTEGVGCSI